MSQYRTVRAPLRALLTVKAETPPGCPALILEGAQQTSTLLYALFCQVFTFWETVLIYDGWPKEKN